MNRVSMEKNQLLPLEIFFSDSVPCNSPDEILSWMCCTITITIAVSVSVIITALITMIIMVAVICALIIWWGQALQDSFVVQDYARHDDLASLYWTVSETVYNTKKLY